MSIGWLSLQIELSETTTWHILGNKLPWFFSKHSETQIVMLNG